MGSKNSVKSKSNHLVMIETRMFRATELQESRCIHSAPIEWGGNGTYIYRNNTCSYVLVTEMHDLEFKLQNANYGVVLYIREEQVSKR